MLKPTKNGCVEFTGSIDDVNGGYGRFRHENSSDGVVRAHRYAFELVYGHCPDLLRHTCNNPRCCNVSHLKAGTAQDNYDDMKRAGRARTKLKPEQAELIVRLRTKRGWSVDDIARHFSVRPKAIHDLLTGRTWSKVTGIQFTPAKPHQRKRLAAA